MDQPVAQELFPNILAIALCDDSASLLCLLWWNGILLAI